EQLALDDRRLQPQLCRADCGDIAAGARSKNDDVVLLSHYALQKQSISGRPELVEGPFFISAPRLNKSGPSTSSGRAVTGAARHSRFHRARTPCLVDRDEGELRLGHLDRFFLVPLAAPGFDR